MFMTNSNKMKKIFFTLLFFFAVCMIFAQGMLRQTASALEKTAQKYNKLAAFALDFKLDMVAMEKNIHNFTGVLLVKQEKYYLTFEDQIIANDGKISWNYQKSINEATLFEAEDDEFMLFHPLKILNNWNTEYSAKVINEEKLQQKTMILIDLTPKKKTFFNKLRLFIDKETNYIQQIIINNADGMTMTYTITKFSPNPPVTDAKFSFNKNDYPNVQVSDMR